MDKGSSPKAAPATIYTLALSASPEALILGAARGIAPMLQGRPAFRRRDDREAVKKEIVTKSV